MTVVEGGCKSKSQDPGPPFPRNLVVKSRAEVVVSLGFVSLYGESQSTPASEIGIVGEPK
jgi:hypothetical protein